MNSVLVRGGDVVTPSGARRADVRCVGERIDSIEAGLTPTSGETVIDAAGLLVLPGIVDAHTHFGLDTGTMRTRDDFASGSRAAAAGGVTTYINFAPQQRGESLLGALERERERADGHTLVDYALHLAFGTPGPGWETEIEAVVARGVSSAKIYTTYRDTIYYTRDWDWLRLMERAGGAGLLVQVHAENDDIVAGQVTELLAAGRRSFRYHGVSRPAIAEIEAVGRALTLCRHTGTGVYLVHLSAPESVRMVSRARSEGLPAFAEVCAHHVSLDHALYRTDSALRYVMTPPLRAADSVAALRDLAVHGHVDVMASDHCGYGLDQRSGNEDFASTSPGIPGVETLWPVVYTTLVAGAGLPVEHAVSLVSARPATVFGLAHRKGFLRPGADADIVLFDPSPRGRLDEHRLHSKAGYSPWHGREIQGRVIRTLCRGVTVYDRAGPGEDLDHGRFVPCEPFDAGRVGQLERLGPSRDGLGPSGDGIETVAEG